MLLSITVTVTTTGTYWILAAVLMLSIFIATPVPSTST